MLSYVSNVLTPLVKVYKAILVARVRHPCLDEYVLRYIVCAASPIFILTFRMAHVLTVWCHFFYHCIGITWPSKCHYVTTKSPLCYYCNGTIFPVHCHHIITPVPLCYHCNYSMSCHYVTITMPLWYRFDGFDIQFRPVPRLGNRLPTSDPEKSLDTWYE